ncbi:uncharacterized protein [Nicotiana sylvestris]|uniref:uncharacterized protein n=1 Tax=Nicotiana sylvestris TaxID=4096 RepID=UPI00388CEB54
MGMYEDSTTRKAGFVSKGTEQNGMSIGVLLSWVMRQLGRCQVMHPDEDLSVYATEVSSDGQFHEETEFVEASQEQWAWLAKENEYRAIIGKLEKQVRDLQFENGLQATADKGEKKRLAKENEVFRAQIREMKIAAENPTRSIKNLRQKVDEYGFDLNKAEGELARAQTKLAKNAEERALLVKQLKEKYDNEIMGLKKRVTTFDNKMIKQAKDFKAEREHCYAAMAQLERDLQQL